MEHSERDAEEEVSQDEHEENEASVGNSVQQASDVPKDLPLDEASGGISDSPGSDTFKHPMQETAEDGKSKCSDDMARNAESLGVEASFLAKSGRVLNARHVVQANETGRHIDILVKETCENTGDSLKGDDNQVSGPEEGGTDLQNKKSSVKSAENRQSAVNEGSWSETGGEEHHEEQSMSMLKYPDSDSEGHSERETSQGEETMLNEESCCAENQHSSDISELVEKIEFEDSTEEMNTLKNMEMESESDKEVLLSGNCMEDIPAESVAKGVFKEFFEMIVRFILAWYFGFNTKCKTVLETVLDEGNDQSTAVKHLLHFEGCSPTGVDIDLRAVRITVTPIPSEGREEAYRWYTFEHSGIDLNFGIRSRLAREGFLCNTNRDITCAFCGQHFNPYNLQQGQHHLNALFHNHRRHCLLRGNIPFDRYGYDSANFVRHTANADILCISGIPYARQGACRYAQQVRNIGLQNLAPSGSHHRPLLHPLPQPNLIETPVRNQERAMNDGNAREPVAQPSLVQVLERVNQPPSPSTNLTTVKETNVSGAETTSLLLDCPPTGATGTTADLPRQSGERETTRRPTTRHTVCGRTSRRSVSYGVFGRVQCFSCGVEMDSWEEDDVPLLEHVREYPDCDFIQEIIRDARTEQPELLNLIVLALVDSSIGSEVMERGFRRQEVAEAIYQVIMRGERISDDTVTVELFARGARPT